jgi:hypothetical protein
MMTIQAQVGIDSSSYPFVVGYDALPRIFTRMYASHTKQTEPGGANSGSVRSIAGAWLR